MTTSPTAALLNLAEFAFLALLLWAPRVHACDACGAGGTYNGFGFMPLVDRPVAVLAFRQLDFQHPAGNWNGDSEVQADRFVSATASVLWMPADRLRMTASVPLRHHVRTESLRTTTLEGVGDVRLDADWNAWGSGAGFWVRAGGGVSAPTGTYMERDDALRQLPAAFQLGRGAWGASLRATAAIAWEQWTVTTNVERSVWGVNEQGRQPGAQIQAQVQGFLRIPGRRTVWLPHAGSQFESWEADRDRGVDVDETGGQRLAWRLGVTAQRGSHLVTAAAERPWGESVAENAPSLGPSVELAWAWQWNEASERTKSRVKFQ